MHSNFIGPKLHSEKNFKYLSILTEKPTFYSFGGITQQNPEWGGDTLYHRAKLIFAKKIVINDVSINGINDILSIGKQHAYKTIFYCDLSSYILLKLCRDANDLNIICRSNSPVKKFIVIESN